METLDNALDFQGTLDNQKLYITEEICEHWLESAKWTRRLGITLVTINLLLFGGMIYLQMMTHIGFPALFWVIYLAISLAFAAIGYFLIQYSRQIKPAANDSNWGGMESAFSDLGTSFAITGFFMFLFLAGLTVMLLIFGKQILSMII